MVGSFAEFEPAMIRERTSAGIAASRAEWREIAESVLSGCKIGAGMARLYGVS